jgi:hypothetical protein
MLRTAVAAFVTVASAWSAATAEELRLDTDFGAVTLLVNRDQETVFGSYPTYEGILAGRVDQDGDLVLGWSQPKGESPCNVARDGTLHWGWARFSIGHDRLVRGSWGYCEAGRAGDWNGVVR